MIGGTIPPLGYENSDEFPTAQFPPAVADAELAGGKNAKAFRMNAGTMRLSLRRSLCRIRTDLRR